ncbi:hypothetical protein FLAG1_06604 [Fusarium langsethiae]|uniref:Uncharacterized protein n=1 Tax=Fusarium langsethiae TaxID=179993 RepID=A0A0M9EVC4_FUSLA|nr:hypothetical protein FLAG1_06604 [Fusarium langsethiae]GKU07807.1 unnamed protein product [Fusarium langsethiae]
MQLINVTTLALVATTPRSLVPSTPTPTAPIPIGAGPWSHDALELLTYCDRLLNTTEGAVGAWFETGAAAQLDKWVLENGSVNWLSDLLRKVNRGAGTTRVDGCPYRENDNCHPDFGKDCFDYFRESESDSFGIDKRKRAAWWIFQGVIKVKSKFSALYTLLIEEGVTKSLTVNEIVKDLGGTPKTGEDVGKWLSLAFGIASSLAGPASTPLSIGLGIFGSALGAVEYEQVDVKDTVEATMEEWLKASFYKIEDQLELAFGAVGSEDEYSKLDKLIRLASGIGNRKPVTAVGRFFAQAPWLLDYSSTRDETIEHFKKIMHTKLAHEAIKAAGWKLFVSLHSNSNEKGCSHIAGDQWIEVDGKHYCAYLAGDGRGDRPSEEYYNEKMPKHGLGLREPYYQNILECGLKRGKISDADGGKLVGGKPSCWFQMDLAYTGVCDWKLKGDVVDCIKSVKYND